MLNLFQDGAVLDQSLVFLSHLLLPALQAFQVIQQLLVILP